MKQLSVILLSLAAASGATASASDVKADRAAIAAVSARFEAAENAGDTQLMHDLLADDIVMLGPDSAAATGLEDVVVRMRRFYDAFAVVVEFESTEIVVFGDWGYDRRTYHYTAMPRAGGDLYQENGKYLWVY